MSTKFHPMTDGQTERVNEIIEAYLRPCLNKEQDHWTDLLPRAEHAYNLNNSVTSATRMTPIYVNYGRHPKTLNPQRTEVMKSHRSRLCTLDQRSIRKRQNSAGSCQKTNVRKHRLQTHTPTGLQNQRPRHALHMTHINEKAISEAGPQIPRPLSNRQSHLAHRGRTDTTTKIENTSFIPCIRTRTIHTQKPPGTQFHQSPLGSERH